MRRKFPPRFDRLCVLRFHLCGPFPPATTIPTTHENLTDGMQRLPSAFSAARETPCGFLSNPLLAVFTANLHNHPAPFLHSANVWVYAKQNQNFVESFSPAQHETQMAFSEKASNGSNRPIFPACWRLSAVGDTDSGIRQSGYPTRNAGRPLFGKRKRRVLWHSVDEYSRASIFGTAERS